MNKTGIALIAVVVVGIIVFGNNINGQSILAKLASNPNQGLSLPAFSLDSLKIPFGNNNPNTKEAWEMLEKYIAFAKNHDLAGIRTVSHQVSATCNNPSLEKECFALMDSVYAFTSMLQESEFRNVAQDEHQTIIYTDGPDRVFIYFTRDTSGELKVLGMRFCKEVESNSDSCVVTNASKLDDNSNGWWNSVESLFYN